MPRPWDIHLPVGATMMACWAGKCCENAEGMLLRTFVIMRLFIAFPSVKSSWRSRVGKETTSPGSPPWSKSISNILSGSLAGTIKLASLKSPCTNPSLRKFSMTLCLGLVVSRWVVPHDQFHDYNVPSSWNSPVAEKLRCVTTLGAEKMKASIDE